MYCSQLGMGVYKLFTEGVTGCMVYLDLNGNIMGWLYHVADREIKQHLRKHNMYYSHNESLDAVITERQIDSLVYTDEYFSAKDIDEQKYLEQIAESLPVEYKAIFRYRFIEKHTIVETSAHVGIPYSSLRLRLSKIEELVRLEIKKIFDK